MTDAERPVPAAERYSCRVNQPGPCGWWIARASDLALEVFRDHVWYAHASCYRCWRRHDPAAACPKPRPVPTS